MTGDQYVASILDKYKILTGSNSPAERTVNLIAPSIRQWSSYWLNSLFISGSYSKGTAVSTGTDVDLFISLKSNIPSTLKEIYNSLYQLSFNNGWNPVQQNVSIGIAYAGVSIDLVPGKIYPGFLNYHSLYRLKTDTWTQTNVSLQVDTVKNSGRTREISAIKIWRDLHHIDFPSFYLELFVIEALKHKRIGQLSSNVIIALSCIGSSLPRTRIVDPANTNNIISDDLSYTEKIKLATQAEISSNKPSWGNIIW